MGRLDYAVEYKNNSYSAAGNLRSTGVLSTIAKYSFEASSQGKIERGVFKPKYYYERSDTGRRKEQKILRYFDHGIELETKKTAKPYWQDPNQQMDALDPMSAIIFILRDQTETNVCKQNRHSDLAILAFFNSGNPEQPGNPTNHFFLFK